MPYESPLPVGCNRDKLELVAPPPLAVRLGAFRRDKDGGLIIFSLYIILCMMLAIGLAIDTVRFEYARAKLQSTLDRAVLAAADLDQTLTAKEVVTDYFAKVGLEEFLVSVDVDEGLNYRTVNAKSEAELNTIFIDMVGIDTLSVPASGTANETLADVEIALVLDNSGSMGSNNDERLDLLKPAAKDFVEAVARDDDDTDGTTAISIIPFATQVNVGEELFSHFKTTGEHDYSHCITFEEADFETVDISTTELLQQTAHFSADYKSWTMKDSYAVCPTWDSREITPWSTDATYLQGRIDDMVASGWTSIELGTKWGAAMLNPDMSDVLTSMADKGLVDESLRGQPFAYDRDNTMKVLVVMSDGANTNQYDIKDPYRSGNSPVYYYKTSNNKEVYSYYYNRNGTSYDYYWVSYQNGSTGYFKWKNYPYGEDKARLLTWPELWADMTVERFTDTIKAKALGGSGSAYYNQIIDETTSSTKNPRTSEICQAAKDAGITIFTIGMETYGQGDETLSDCASSATYFYDVKSLDISTAFAAIARQINQLRLTH